MSHLPLLPLSAYLLVLLLSLSSHFSMPPLPILFLWNTWWVLAPPLPLSDYLFPVHVLDRLTIHCKKCSSHLVSSSSFCTGLSGGEEFKVACLAPEIAWQTSDGQLWCGDCALWWPFRIWRGFTVSNSGMLVCATSPGRPSWQFEKREEAKWLWEEPFTVRFVHQSTIWGINPRNKRHFERSSQEALYHASVCEHYTCIIVQ